jgi:hypothetical protein
MTPQERQRVTELFDRLATLENNPRDPDAGRAIADGLKRAPNAVYALVQTVLVQNEALSHAAARIRELEEGRGEEQGSFLDSMRSALFGRDQNARDSRGSVPSVSQGSKWNSGQTLGGGFAQSGGFAQPMQPMQATQQGGSFLGTAAAAALGVIGGSMLFNGLRSMMGGPGGSAFASPYDGPPFEDRQSPWSDASRSDLAREAGLNDIGDSRSSPFDDRGQATGLMDDGTSNGADDFSDADFDNGFSGDSSDV